MYLCFMIKFKEFVISFITFAIVISKCSLYLNRNFTYFLDKHTHLLEKYDIEKDTKTKKMAFVFTKQCMGQLCDGKYSKLAKLHFSYLSYKYRLYDCMDIKPFRTINVFL